MATTTNYAWETPDDTDLVKDGAAAIRTLGSSIDTTTKALNPSTTLGDIEYRSSTANTNTRLGIGSTGQVLTVSGGVPAWTTISSAPTFVGCALYKSASQSIANATYTAVTFDSENFDSDGFHSTSTNTSRITIPSGKGGKYMLTGTGHYPGGTSGGREFNIYKNGTLINYTNAVPASASVGIIQSFAFLVNAVAGDYFELYTYQSSGGSVNVVGGIDSTQFAISYQGA